MFEGGIVHLQNLLWIGLSRLFLERSVIKIFNQNARWDVHYTNTYKNLGMTIFYLFPTVMYDRDVDLEDEVLTEETVIIGETTANDEVIK